MGTTIPYSSKIENNASLKDAFFDCRDLSYSSGTSPSLFSSTREYKVNNGKVDINGEGLFNSYKFLYGYDIAEMRKNDKLDYFAYDKDGDGNFEVKYDKKDKVETVTLDNDSNGYMEEMYKYENGVLREYCTYSNDGRQILSHVTYDENGKQEGLGTQLSNSFGCFLANLLFGKLFETIES